MTASRFHPVVERWFRQTLGEPTAPQRLGWEHIAAGEHTLIAAPTGTGKTLAAFLWALDGLLRQGESLPDATTVLYVSPLRALSNDVRLNLLAPLEAIRALDPSLPEVRVLVRTGDTPASERAKMMRKAPHVLVTTPESLFILLTSDGGRRMLSSVRTVIVDEIHALARDKRGSHLALSLERLSALVEDGPGSGLLSGATLADGADGADARPAPPAPNCGSLAGTAVARAVPAPRERLQRIGLSATQKPLDAVARLLVGVGRECALVDAGHLRRLDLDVLLPQSPLAAVCSHEQWGEIYAQMAELIRSHRTTLIFVNTRKLAERLAARLTEQLGPDAVACHHGSLSREMRQDAEQRLKAGKLSALVATASLELGIDIGDVDLVLQVSTARSIATLLQRIGRAGHGVARVPKGRLFPLTLDEAVESLALLASVRQGLLDRTPQPPAALDILAQQIVAACVPQAWDEDALYACLTRAWPYRELPRADFDAAVALHTQGRHALLHRDGVQRRLLAAKRARMPALTSGGAIPDNADYSVVLEPEGTYIGTLNEDFAIESNVRDIFQLGNTSWQIVKVEPGTVRVVDAKGQPPTLPFWLGEAPSRTSELSEQIGLLREGCARAMGWHERWADAAGPVATPAGDAAHGAPGDATDDAADGVARGPAEGAEAGRLPPRGRFPLDVAAGARWLAEQVAVEGSAEVGRVVAEQVAAHIAEGVTALGAPPTQRRLVAERFFDETGGQQLVLHSPFGGRINRAFGLALRKRFCRGFGFELQAAANEEAILISLGPHHSFPLADVFKFLHPASARDLLVQALLAAPMFTTRWRWNVARSLQLPRLRDGRKVPPALQRMRAEDLLVAAFPQAVACGETLPPGDLPVPMEHPLVRQTIEDCLHEAMDVDGLLELLGGLQSGRIEALAIDTPQPSVFASGVLTAAPWAFLDDAPLEERRTQAVMRRGSGSAAQADAIGALDPAAIALVRGQAWPEPGSVEELHEALLWMGFLADEEAHAHGWSTWLLDLAAAQRVVRVESPAVASALAHDVPCDVDEGAGRGGRAAGSRTLRWFAAEAPRGGKAVLAGRLEALGPVDGEGPLATEFAQEMLELEADGVVLRTRIDGRPHWCNRRLLARIHRATIETLRAEIEPVPAADFLRFLARWQHVAPGYQLQGPRGVLEVVTQLAGFEVPAASWESQVLPARVAGYQRAWLDELMLSGEVAWGRLWGAGTGAIRATPVALFLREDLPRWSELTAPGDAWSCKGSAAAVQSLLASRGACFQQELVRAGHLLPAQVEQGLADLVGLGLATCDTFGGLRSLWAPRRTPFHAPGHEARGARRPPAATGRWSLFREAGLAPSGTAATPAGPGSPPAAATPSLAAAVGWPAPGRAAEAAAARAAERAAQAAARLAEQAATAASADFLARQLLARTGVVFKRTIARERLPVSWYDILKVFRRMEARGEIRGGRFVAGFAGEQYALPAAIEQLRAVRRASGATAAGVRDPGREAPHATEGESPAAHGVAEPITVSAADPLNFTGILTPEERVASTRRTTVRVA